MSPLAQEALALLLVGLAALYLLRHALRAARRLWRGAGCGGDCGKGCAPAPESTQGGKTRPAEWMDLSSPEGR